mmetsp:Transcript_35597/g.107552  ORF Transcript_35597/g.107552 Transcript_35597/m.107552 type:complete len:270 (-) Transcript_35597:429-1238(-)
MGGGGLPVRFAHVAPRGHGAPRAQHVAANTRHAWAAVGLRKPLRRPQGVPGRLGVDVHGAGREARQGAGKQRGPVPVSLHQVRHVQRARPQNAGQACFQHCPHLLLVLSRARRSPCTTAGVADPAFVERSKGVVRRGVWQLPISAQQMDPRTVAVARRGLKREPDSERPVKSAASWPKHRLGVAPRLGKEPVLLVGPPMRRVLFEPHARNSRLRALRPTGRRGRLDSAAIRVRRRGRRVANLQKQRLEHLVQALWPLDCNNAAAARPVA